MVNCDVVYIIIIIIIIIPVFSVFVTHKRIH